MAWSCSNEVLIRIAASNPEGIRALILHCFAGLSLQQVANLTRVPEAKARELVGMTQTVLEMHLED